MTLHFINLSGIVQGRQIFLQIDCKNGQTQYPVCPRLSCAASIPRIQHSKINHTGSGGGFHSQILSLFYTTIYMYMHSRRRWQSWRRTKKKNKQNFIFGFRFVLFCVRSHFVDLNSFNYPLSFALRHRQQYIQMLQEDSLTKSLIFVFGLSSTSANTNKQTNQQQQKRSNTSI